MEDLIAEIDTKPQLIKAFISIREGIELVSHNDNSVS